MGRWDADEGRRGGRSVSDIRKVINKNSTVKKFNFLPSVEIKHIFIEYVLLVKILEAGSCINNCTLVFFCL